MFLSEPLSSNLFSHQNTRKLNKVLLNRFIYFFTKTQYVPSSYSHETSSLYCTLGNTGEL